MFNPLSRRLQELSPQGTASAICGRRLRLPPAQLIEGLPALGCVLYVPMWGFRSPAQEMPPGLLVETLLLAPLLRIRRLVAASSITVEGPREWIECVDRRGDTCARLYLLPDTDYLAWDALLACAGPATTMPAPRRPHESGPLGAQLLCFQVRWLGGLQVLGGEIVSRRVSPLGRQLAGLIARAEAASCWRTPCD
ncbi:hypothetical protein ACFPPA_15695 [Rhodanobacter ginsengisoli]|uniref:Uncharacterized protein n=1 Tax=Rhodanobacter ginsengisoli TaxID=418646 RepID=A0ABW0QWE1_9GAMM